jgi:aromatic ring-cleaving dioxygenase
VLGKRQKTKDKSKKLRNEVTNRNEVELGEAKSRKAGTKANGKWETRNE